METGTGVIYITNGQDMMEDMVFDNGVLEDAAQEIVDKLMSLLNLDLLPGATLIEDTIVGDELFANKLKEKYGIEMTEIDLYKLCNKDKVQKEREKYDFKKFLESSKDMIYKIADKNSKGEPIIPKHDEWRDESEWEEPKKPTIEEMEQALGLDKVEPIKLNFSASKEMLKTGDYFNDWYYHEIKKLYDEYEKEKN